MQIIKHSILPSYLLAACFGIVLVGVGFFIAPNTASAQLFEQLTPENGWECNNNKSSCTHTTTDTTNRYYNATASCEVFSSGSTIGGGGSVNYDCVITLANGSEERSYTNVAPGATTQVGSGTNEDGELVGYGSTYTPAGNDCELLNPFSWLTCATRALAGVVLTFATFILGIAGVLFNWAIVKTVFEFSTLIGNSEGLLTAWGILRDIGNMLLLFGFIFIGLAMILDLHSYPAKRTLPRLIIFAVLMNFSLFAAEAVIDVSNGLSAILYEQAQGETDPCLVENVAAGEDRGECAINYGVAGHIMQSTGISSIYTLDTNILSIDTTVLLGLSIFATIAAVVLFAAAIMLVIRAVTLTLLMVVAPIGFAAMAIPPLEKVGKDWWHRLINQSFFAPIMLLLFFVSLKITETLAGADTRGNLAAALTNQNAGVMGVILVFFIVIAFLIASLMAAKRFGAMGADLAIKTAGSVTYGTMGFAGRRTIGRGSDRLAGSIRKSSFGKTEMGRRVSTFVGKGATASFDARLAGPVKWAAGAGKIDLGKPGKDAQKGFKGEKEAAVKKRTEYSEKLELNDEEKKRDEALKDQKGAIQGAWNSKKKNHVNRILSQERAVKEFDSGAREQRLRQQLEEATARSGEALAAGNFDEVGRQAEEAKRIEALIADLPNQAAEQQRILDGIKQAYADEAKLFKDQLDEIEAQIFENNPKGRYAKKLESSSKITSRIFLGTGANPAAAKKIKAELKKSKTEKSLEKLEKAIKDSGHKHDAALEDVKESAKRDEHDDHGGGDHGATDHGGGPSGGGGGPAHH